jgi:DNA invertase Pin-like site-specific DNA recombinase
MSNFSSNQKCVIFARVSSREQEETGYSLPAQEKLLKQYTERKGFKIDKIFSISESASGKRQRDIFNEMLDYAKRNRLKIIVCEKVDRLTRNFKDAVMIDEWLEKDDERQVHLVKDTLVLHRNSRSQEKLNWGIRILFAKNYIDNLSEEVKKGQKEKIAQGWLPTKPPFGYRTVGEKGHKIHVVDKKTAPIVKRGFELYSVL